MATFDERFHTALRELPPSYFALVMATGIVSIDLHTEGYDVLSDILLVVGIAALVALLGLNGWRFLAHRGQMWWDFVHPLRGFGFYTFVAAGNVLASRIAHEHTTTALVLLGITTTCWLVRGYVLPWTTRLEENERPVVIAANGGWFMWAVGAQSIAVAAAAVDALRPNSLLGFIAVMAWTIGLFLYLLVGVLVAIRLLVYPITAEHLTPPYWIAMGAAAITALAGTTVAHLPAEPYVDLTRTVIRTGGLLAWIIAIWLIPALIGVGWWRHATGRIPLRYTVDLWSISFPVGMITAATQALAHDDALPGLDVAGTIGTWVAFGVWLIFGAMGVDHVVRTVLLDRNSR